MIKFTAWPTAKVGFGGGVSHALVEGIAENGRGAADFVLGAAELEPTLGDIYVSPLVPTKFTNLVVMSIFPLWGWL